MIGNIRRRKAGDDKLKMTNNEGSLLELHQ